MEHPGTKTQQEILSQPDVWRATLRTLDDRRDELRRHWSDDQYDSIVFTGCGSTYYLSLTAAAALAQLTGNVCRGVPASELLLYPDTFYSSTRRTLLVAISRSGETTETVNAARAFVESGQGTLVTFSCYPDQPLAQLGSLNIVLPDAQEESVVQTRAFTSLLLGVMSAAATWAGRDHLLEQLERLPGIGHGFMDMQLPVASHIATTSDFENCYFLGSGPQYGLACEAGLKMKEIALTPSEPFHFLELRHGPKSIVSSSMLVVALYSSEHFSIERDVMSEVASLGGQTLSIGETGADMNFACELDQAVRCLLYLPPIQWLAVGRALQRGIDPDHPKNLDSVVRLDMPS
jgi:glutamine---fructose-6-phosphate transaminase (isomerizing)